MSAPTYTLTGSTVGAMKDGDVVCLATDDGDDLFRVSFSTETTATVTRLRWRERVGYRAACWCHWVAEHVKTLYAGL